MSAYYFKKGLFGRMILMVVKREPTESPGSFRPVFVYASKEESTEFMKNYKELTGKSKLYDKIKKENPEIFI